MLRFIGYFFIAIGIPLLIFTCVPGVISMALGAILVIAGEAGASRKAAAAGGGVGVGGVLGVLFMVGLGAAAYFWGKSGKGDSRAPVAPIAGRSAQPDPVAAVESSRPDPAPVTRPVSTEIAAPSATSPPDKQPEPVLDRPSSAVTQADEPEPAPEKPAPAKPQKPTEADKAEWERLAKIDFNMAAGVEKAGNLPAALKRYQAVADTYWMTPTGAKAKAAAKRLQKQIEKKS